ncbi:RNA-directed DNA polymerase [Vibrio parahaemolyticus]|nr:reverse transcriptase domain-containing protein [Vibrio parahaemolyticus]MCF9126036.1 RNA-directed DNA polymerase [Vibrio parahaemolyticus]NCM80717.1 RNA-directed DNA polymerase [Vibrio parahaemolyticus]
MQQPLEFSEFEPIKFGNGDETIWGNPTLSPRLTRDHKVAETLLLNLESDNDVANLLEIPTGQLLYILYEKPKRYTIFSIKKKSGKPRLIESPNSSIRILQNKLRPLLEAQYKIKKPVHGFVGNGKSIISNAEQHKKKNYLLNIDLLDFFHSVNFGRVQGIFRNTPFNMGYKAATVLAHLCTHNKRLPQGAPTSPVLSNLASTTLDKKLVQLAKRFQLTYTRYADDITFSSNRPFPPLLVETIHLEDGTSHHRVGKALKQAVEDSGFAVNPNKTRVQHRSQRQEVTGLIVNEGVNVNRKFIRNTRAMLHSWRKDLIEAELTYLKNRYHAVDVNKSNLTGDIFKRAIYGRLSFIKMVKGQEHGPYLNLCRQALELDNNPPKSIAKLKGVFEMFDVFICHASEDKEAIALPLYDE